MDYPEKIAFIPLRGGSKSIPLKNIKNFCGYPLAYWVINELNKSNIDTIYIATDSDTIKQELLSYSFPKLKIYNRLEQNAQDHSSTEDVMLEFINNLSLHEDSTFILVQATSPFTQSTDFNNALTLLEKKNADSLLSVTVNKRFFWNTNGTPINYNYNKRPRRQEFEGYFMENGAFYINSVRNIKKYKNRLSGKISLYVMPDYTSIEIDEEVDWIIAEQIMKTYIIK